MVVSKAFSVQGFADPAAKLGPGDIVVVGAGLAGLFTALKLAPWPVTVVAAAPLGVGASSAWAQGGIAAAVGADDDVALHAADTIAAGAGLVDPRIAHLVAEEGPARIDDLLDYGVAFDRDAAGRFVLSREAAHGLARIVRVSGDRTGAAVMAAIVAAVRATPSIRVLEHHEAEELIVEDGRVTGVRLARSPATGNGSYDLIPASAVVLATGGIGSLYAVTTNPAYARGEAMAFAARAGAAVADAEFVQFHPTAIDVGLAPAPLATEALRGEGAILVNAAGERFMAGRDPAAELAPRDVVARGVFAEIAAGRGAFLDCTKAIGARFPEHFPTVYAFCRDAGIDPVTQPIPVAPAAHYHMGGVATDDRGRTTLAGLWAVGEVASTGLHGANRLASNSLLEAIVFGARAATDIRNLVAFDRAAPIAEALPVGPTERLAPDKRARLLARLRRAMTDDVGVLRSARGLERALATLREVEAAANGDKLVINMATAGQLVAGSALMRRESRGAHFRTDYPAADAALAHRRAVTLEEIASLPVRSRATAEADTPSRAAL